MSLKRIVTNQGEIYFVDSKTGERVVTDKDYTPNSLKIPASAKAYSNEPNQELTKTSLATIIKVFGIIYFIISLLGGIVFWIESSKEIEKSVFGVTIPTENIDSTMRAIAIGGIVGSFIVLFICLGISMIIRQNVYLIHRINRLNQ